MDIRKIIKIFIISFIGIISFSCTLNYSKEAEFFEKKPNFVFKNSNLDRYEENSLNLKINFDKLEIYDTDKIWAGEKITFVKINSKTDEENKSDGKREKLSGYKGSAGIIKIDEKNEKYFLGGKVFFEDIKEGVAISGEAFFWDKTSGVLYGSKEGRVSVKKGEELDITGEGFIANTVSREFEFSSVVSGNILTASEKTEDKENADETIFK
ncbi:hypothetical protein [Treponema pedis]|uniref:hypothetical protein n=1 Tax=Treponema pedis TaxID=409322 RepID=UPI0003F88FA0|nr:hypothetical protein [Treponema pedis]QSI04703.1 hypothetical protein DYQ05_07005 [Treponema pedis]